MTQSSELRTTIGIDINLINRWKLNKIRRPVTRQYRKLFFFEFLILLPAHPIPIVLSILNYFRFVSWMLSIFIRCCLNLLFSASSNFFFVIVSSSVDSLMSSLLLLMFCVIFFLFVLSCDQKVEKTSDKWVWRNGVTIMEQSDFCALGSLIAEIYKSLINISYSFEQDSQREQMKFFHLFHIMDFATSQLSSAWLWLIHCRPNACLVHQFESWIYPHCQLKREKNGLY